MNISIWWAIPALTALVGILLVGGGLGRIFRFRVWSGLTRFLFGGVFIGGAATAVLFGLNLQTYARLNHEAVAAEVSLTKTGPQAFSAVVRRPDASGQYGPPATYALTGDAFRMDARFLKWRPWANVMGVDAIFRLDRIQGRFDSAEAENAAHPTAHDMSPPESPAALDIYRLARENVLVKGLKAVDAIYGSGAYAPMADGAVYEVRATQTGLIPRPVNAIAKQATQDWGAPLPEAPETVSITGAQPLDK